MHNVIKLDSWLFYPWQFPASSTKGNAPLPIVLGNINVKMQGGYGPMDTEKGFCINKNNLWLMFSYFFPFTLAQQLGSVQQ